MRATILVKTTLELNETLVEMKLSGKQSYINNYNIPSTFALVKYEINYDFKGQ